MTNRDSSFVTNIQHSTNLFISLSTERRHLFVTKSKENIEHNKIVNWINTFDIVSYGLEIIFIVYSFANVLVVPTLLSFPFFLFMHDTRRDGESFSRWLGFTKHKKRILFYFLSNPLSLLLEKCLLFSDLI